MRGMAGGGAWGDDQGPSGAWRVGGGGERASVGMGCV